MLSKATTDIKEQELSQAFESICGIGQIGARTLKEHLEEKA